MDVSVELKWNPTTKKGLKKIPDDILYTVAKITLDMSIPMIPKSNMVGHSGTLRRSSQAGGVRGGNGDYYIGSYTNYAKHVWNMSNVNWTTPGTNGKWYARTLKKHQTTIVKNAISQSRKKDLQ